MKLGLYLRNMGPASTRETLLACARGAEAEGVDDLWVADHVAIPPDDAEGSNGRYVDPLATLAWLAGATERISLGTGVLVLPYRPPLATAKWVAAIQELSGGRFLFGVGVGWMEPEFRAVGVRFADRARMSDAILTFIERCFAGDEVEANGQRFLFKPRPERPPLFVGGAAPHAIRRALRFGGGWMPMGGAPDQLAGPIRALREGAAAAGRPPPEVALVTRLELDDPDRAAEQVVTLAAAGVSRIVHGFRYTEQAPFLDAAAKLATLRERIDR
jgi:probable F420-dependent oxidoreductase